MLKRTVIWTILATLTGACASAASFELEKFGKTDISVSAEGMVRTVPVPGPVQKIVGGEDAAEGEFPFMAALFIDMDFCGGSLVKEDWILTAAHCIHKGRIVALIGAVSPDFGSDQFTADRVVVHPGWSPKTMDYDFALVHLPARSKFKPVALNRAPLEGDLSFVAAGWGLTATNGNLSNRLKKASLQLIPEGRCASQLPPSESGLLTDRMICAGIEAGGTGTCHGDSGGPLLLKTPAGMTLAGVTSWGPNEGCALPGKPNGFGKVSAVADWIEATTADTAAHSR